MGVQHAEVPEAFRSIDVPKDKAIKAATALSASLSKVDETADRGFAKRDAGIEAIGKDITAMKLDVVGIKSELVNMGWMGGVVIALVTTVLFRVFTH